MLLFFDREKERKKLEEEERRESCSRPGTPEDDDPGGGGNPSGVPNGISPRKLHKKFGKWGGLEGGPSRFGHYFSVFSFRIAKKIMDLTGV